MFLFMILLFPIVLGFCCARTVRAEKSWMYAFLIALGAFVGILVSGCTAFFSYMHRVPEYSFVNNFLYFLLKMYLLPALVFYGLFFAISKDTVEFKVNAFFPLTATFYAVYMPYITIASYSAAFSFYLLFVKPVLVLSMVYLLKPAVKEFSGAILAKNIKKSFAVGGILLLIVLIPALLETLYFMAWVLPVVYILAVLYGAFALAVFFTEYKLKSEI